MSHESESALERIFEYFRAFCRGRRPSCVKVVELFVVDGEMDVDAVSELSNLLRNKNVKNNILEISCGLSFRYDSSKREISNCITSSFDDIHISMIRSCLSNCEAESLQRKRQHTSHDETKPDPIIRKARKAACDLHRRALANLVDSVEYNSETLLDIKRYELPLIGQMLIERGERGVLCSSVVDFDFHDVHAKKLVEGLHSYIPQRAKELAMKLTSTCGDDCELEDAIETLRRWNMNVFGSLTLKKVKRWREAEARTKEKRGRKVMVDFEFEVWNEIVLWAIIPKEGDEEHDVVTSTKRLSKGMILRSIAYNYEIIRERAKSVQTLSKWQDDVNVQKLQFSDHWVHDFIKRMKFSRRKITSDKKVLMSLAEIRSKMVASQNRIVSGGYSPHQIANLDETALTFGIGPTHMYVPVDQTRATADAANIKARVTLIPTVDASGRFLPLMFILKHSKSSDTHPDQTSMTVVKNLHKKPGFRAADGWKLDEWERELTIKSKKGVDVTRKHKVNYLKHEGLTNS